MAGVKGRSGSKKIPGKTRNSSGRIVYESLTSVCSCGRPKRSASQQCKRCRSDHAIEHVECATCGRMFIRSNHKNPGAETCCRACGQALASVRQASLLVANGTSRLRTFICAWCHKTVTRPVRPVHDAGVCCSRPCGFAYRDAKRRTAKKERLQRIRTERERARRAKKEQRMQLARARMKCEVCGAETQKKTSKLCVPCRHQRRHQMLTAEPVQCPMCGQVFGGSIMKVFCSKECSHRAARYRGVIPRHVSAAEQAEWRAIVFMLKSYRRVTNQGGIHG